MTAHAELAGSRLRGTITKQTRVLLAGAALTLSTGADAQAGALVSVYSDYRFRGVSLSDRRPVGIIDLSYDLPGGLYAALSGRLVAAEGEGVKPLGYAVNAGYAKRLRADVAIDFGIVNSGYSHYSGLNGGRSYTEIYAGISGKLLGARLSVSPDYLGSARWTAYGEIDGHVDLSRRTTINANVGVLGGLSNHYHGIGRPQLDARLGIGQRMGPVTLHAAVTAQGHNYLYSARAPHHLGFVIGASTAL